MTSKDSTLAPKRAWKNSFNYRGENLEMEYSVRDPSF
jgi:hypothetical protein